MSIGRTRFVPLVLATLFTHAPAQDRLVPPAADAPPSTTPAPVYSASAWTDVRFVYSRPGATTIEYVVPLNDGSAAGNRVLDGQVEVRARVGNGAFFQPITRGGLRYRARLEAKTEPCDEVPVATEVVLEPPAFADATAAVMAAPVELPGQDAVELRYTDTFLDGSTRERVHRFSLEGSALKIEIEDLDTAATTGALDYYCGFSAGESAGTPGVADAVLPYSLFPAGVFEDASTGEPRFYSATTDPTRGTTLEFLPHRRPAPSTGGLGAGMRTKSLPDTDGNVVRFRETVYVVASDRVLDVVPRPTVASPPGAKRDDLDHRVVFDMRTQLNYQQFGGGEVAWTPPPTMRGDVTADVVVHYERFEQVNPNDPVLLWPSDDRVRFEIRTTDHAGTEVILHEEWVADSTERTATFSGVEVREGSALRFRVDAGGVAHDVGLRMTPIVTSGGQTFQIDVPGYLGPQGPVWHFRNFFEELVSDMEFSPIGVWIPWRGGGVAGFIRLSTTLLAGGELAVEVKPTLPRFLATIQWFERLHDLGLRDLVTIDHFWQQFGFDQKLPDVAPAYPPHQSNLANGTDFMDLMAAGKALGFLMTLHENYHLVDPTWPQYTPDLTALDSHGCEREFFQLNALDLDKADDLAAAEEAQIEMLYDPGGVYDDAGTALEPWYGIDLDATNPTEKTSREAISLLFGLFDQMSDQYEGPLFGEGGIFLDTRYHTYYAGHMHGVGRDHPARERVPVLPDYELESIRPLMVGQGMGPFDRYFPLSKLDPNGYPTEERLLEYRAKAISYGHSGWLSGLVYELPPGAPAAHLWSLADLTRLYFDEYHAMRAVQERYLESTRGVVSTTYDLPGGPAGLSLDELLAQGHDLSSPRITTTYENGLVVRANFDTGRPLASSLADFSAVQGHRGWRQLMDNPLGALVEMPWVSDIDHYSGRGGSLSPDLAVAEGGRLVREYTLPTDGDYVVHLHVGNHTLIPADVEILHDGAPIASATGLTFSTGPIDLAPAISQAMAGDVIELVVRPVDDGDPMTTEISNGPFIAIVERTAPAADPTWTVVEGGTSYPLPPHGTLVVDAGLLAFSAVMPGAGHIDYVDAPTYDYLRARGGILAFHGALGTDGSVAVHDVDVPGLGPAQELHLVAGTVLHQGPAGSPPALELDRTGSCQVLWDGPTTLRLEPDFTAGDAPVRISYRGLVGAGLAAPPQVFEVDPATAVPLAHPSTFAGEVLVIDGARPGWTYLVTW